MSIETKYVSWHIGYRVRQQRNLNWRTLCFGRSYDDALNAILPALLEFDDLERREVESLVVEKLVEDSNTRQMKYVPITSEPVRKYKIRAGMMRYNAERQRRKEESQVNHVSVG